jgi:hypothetical protein
MRCESKDVKDEEGVVEGMSVVDDMDIELKNGGHGMAVSIIYPSVGEDASFSCSLRSSKTQLLTAITTERIDDPVFEQELLCKLLGFSADGERIDLNSDN